MSKCINADTVADSSSYVWRCSIGPKFYVKYFMYLHGPFDDAALVEFFSTQLNELGQEYAKSSTLRRVRAVREIQAQNLTKIALQAMLQYFDPKHKNCIKYYEQTVHLLQLLGDK